MLFCTRKRKTKKIQVAFTHPGFRTNFMILYICWIFNPNFSPISPRTSLIKAWTYDKKSLMIWLFFDRTLKNNMFCPNFKIKALFVTWTSFYSKARILTKEIRLFLDLLDNDSIPTDPRDPSMINDLTYFH